MELGDAIRKIRREKHIKKTTLAENTGISLTGLYNIEHNKSFPTSNTIKRISEGLCVSVAYVLMSMLTEDDISGNKRDAFRKLYPIIKSLG